jgi:NADPH2:quinone reductase
VNAAHVRDGTRMRAIVITKPGGPEVLQLVDRPAPEPSRGEVRVRVRATAINRADLLQRMGAYPAPADASPDIPGLEFAGEVEALGPGVERLAIGDRVFGLTGGGAYAEQLVSHERALARIPEGLSFEHAAAIPEAFITAHDAIVGQAGLRGGETLLVHAVGSGVGTAAVQLGRALGVFVIGTARTADKLERAQALGLDAGVVAENAKFADAVRKHGEPSVVLELIGGPYVDEDIRTVAVLGRIVLVGLLAGGRNEVDLGGILRKRLRVFGTVLRARPLEEKLAAMRTFEAQVVPLLQRGLIAPVIDTVMDLDAAGAAHARMASNVGFGKIVLRV